MPAFWMCHAYPHDVPQYLSIWPPLHLRHRSVVVDIDLVLVGGFERGTHWHFDLCRADLLPFVEQLLKRGMHLLDGLILEEGHRV
jgi:hypothetical protein